MLLKGRLVETAFFVMFMFPLPSCPGFHPAQSFTLLRVSPCPEFHSAQGFTLRYVYVPPSGEWITVILPCPAAQGYTLRYVYVPLSGEWITVILPRVSPRPELYTGLCVCSPFRGSDYRVILPRVTSWVMCMFPLQGNGLSQFRFFGILQTFN